MWHACRARAVAVKHLTNAAAAAKARMATGAQANCLLDAWVESMILTKKFEDGKGERPKVMVREHGNHEMALVLLSFIFASQGEFLRSRCFQRVADLSVVDAMSSALTYGFQNLADHPEVLAKVRAEQAEVRGDDTTSALTLETLEQMPYINAVVREVLRHRPPVVMVPYKTLKPFPITPEYTVPTGTMLIPSFWNSLHDEETFPDADSFIPERWLPGGANEDLSASASKWLVFGAGAHKCIGELSRQHCPLLTDVDCLFGACSTLSVRLRLFLPLPSVRTAEKSLTLSPMLFCTQPVNLTCFCIYNRL